MTLLPAASLIATTYNQPVDLDLYLATARLQCRDDFEIIIADDGSGPETREVIERHRAFFGDRLVHVWHEDTGYRKTKILNLAVHRVRSELIVFTDSDLILHPEFISDHIRSYQPRGLFMGRRVDLGPLVSEWIRHHKSLLYTPTFYAKVFLSASARGETKNINRALRISNGSFSRFLGMHRVSDLLGSNFSIEKKLLLELNGFNEALDHYWGEDGDLFVRARNAGAAITGRKSYAVQFHLWHSLRKPKPDAEVWYQNLLMDHEYVRCDRGLMPK